MDEINIEVVRALHEALAALATPPTLVMRKRKRGPEPVHESPTPTPTPPCSVRSDSPTVRWPSLSPEPQPQEQQRALSARVISIQKHKSLVEKWCRKNQEQHPWVVPPTQLHVQIYAYLAQPPSQRDISLLPSDPVQRRWILHRCACIKKQAGEKKRRIIQNEDYALHAALIEAHGEVEHRGAKRMGYWLSSRYLFPPSDNFLRVWCSSCPECKNAK